MTFLALDVGNTRLKWAQYDAPAVGAKLLAHGAVFLENIDRLAEDEWKSLSAPSSILGCIVAGDAVKRRVAEQLELWDALPRWVVSSPEEAGLRNGYDHPARLGADRWVAMIGAHHRLLARGVRKPCLVVMVGTAVTVEAIDATGKFLGGIILPGHGIMLRALESGTAGLHMVDNITRHCGEAPACIMTGGAGWKMVPSMSVPVELVEGLIFDGLLEIASRRFAV